MENHPMWIFGYGSLIWKPSFPFAERSPAHIHGWARRFYQGSNDHRGVPEAPGRVVTLLPEETAVCWGMAYRIEEGVQEILTHLDYREKCGYERHETNTVLGRPDAPERTVSALVYVATASNPDYLGPASPEAIAQHVKRSHGPSGSNTEYALSLAAALREMKVVDQHVIDVETALIGS